MTNEKLLALSSLYGIALRAINRVDENEVKRATEIIEKFANTHKDNDGYVYDAYECLIWLWFPLNNYYLRQIGRSKIVGLMRGSVEYTMRCPDCKGLHMKNFVKYMSVTLVNGDNYKLHYAMEVQSIKTFIKKDVLYQTYTNLCGEKIDCYYGKEMIE